MNIDINAAELEELDPISPTIGAHLHADGPGFINARRDELSLTVRPVGCNSDQVSHFLECLDPIIMGQQSETNPDPFYLSLIIRHIMGSLAHIFGNRRRRDG